MKLYLDSGKIEEVKEIANLGVLDGVTTNPTLIKKAGGDFKKTIKEISKIISKHTKDFTVSAEVTSNNSKEMIKEGKDLAKIHKNVIIKVPITPEGIIAIKSLSKLKIRTNATLCFSLTQAILAAKAGAYFVSPFIGRLDDSGIDGLELIDEIRTAFDNYNLKTQILSASIRGIEHVKNVMLIGSDAATIPYGVFKKMFKHPLTTMGLEQFNKDWATYKKQTKRSKK